MAYMQVVQKRRKVLVGFFVSVVMIFSTAACCVAADYVAIKIYPEHVGVFTTVNKQQFVAYGVTENFAHVNITRRVDWKSSNASLVTIDDIGMASVVAGKTAGQVKITCSYPKTGGGTGAGVNLLLLDN